MMNSLIALTQSLAPYLVIAAAVAGLFFLLGLGVLASILFENWHEERRKEFARRLLIGTRNGSRAPEPALAARPVLTKAAAG